MGDGGMEFFRYCRGEFLHGWGDFWGCCWFEEGLPRGGGGGFLVL